MFAYIKSQQKHLLLRFDIKWMLELNHQHNAQVNKQTLKSSTGSRGALSNAFAVCRSFPNRREKIMKNYAVELEVKSLDDTLRLIEHHGNRLGAENGMRLETTWWVWLWWQLCVVESCMNVGIQLALETATHLQSLSCHQSHNQAQSKLSALIQSRSTIRPSKAFTKTQKSFLVVLCFRPVALVTCKSVERSLSFVYRPPLLPKFTLQERPKKKGKERKLFEHEAQKEI